MNVLRSGIVTMLLLAAFSVQAARSEEHTSELQSPLLLSRMPSSA